MHGEVWCADGKVCMVRCVYVRCGVQMVRCAW